MHTWIIKGLLQMWKCFALLKERGFTDLKIVECFECGRGKQGQPRQMIETYRWFQNPYILSTVSIFTFSQKALTKVKIK